MAENKKLTMPKMVIIGGSAGSLTVLLKMLPEIRIDFPAPIVLVTHRHSSSEDRMLEILLRTKTRLAVKEAEEKEMLMAGTIYIAPADYHLLFEDDYSFSLDYSEKVNYSRPSIDVSFESAAKIYGYGAIALLLSGANADGANGLIAIRHYGGTVIVQDPKSADLSYMPEQALLRLSPDHIVSDFKLAPLINAIIDTL